MNFFVLRKIYLNEALHGSQDQFEVDFASIIDKFPVKTCSRMLVRFSSLSSLSPWLSFKLSPSKIIMSSSAFFPSSDSLEKKSISQDYVLQVYKNFYSIFNNKTATHSKLFGSSETSLISTSQGSTGGGSGTIQLFISGLSWTEDRSLNGSDAGRGTSGGGALAFSRHNCT